MIDDRHSPIVDTYKSGKMQWAAVRTCFDVINEPPQLNVAFVPVSRAIIGGAIFYI